MFNFIESETPSELEIVSNELGTKKTAPIIIIEAIMIILPFTGSNYTILFSMIELNNFA